MVATRFSMKSTIGFHISEPEVKSQTSPPPSGRIRSVSRTERRCAASVKSSTVGSTDLNAACSTPWRKASRVTRWEEPCDVVIAAMIDEGRGCCPVLMVGVSKSLKVRNLNLGTMRSDITYAMTCVMERCPVTRSRRLNQQPACGYHDSAQIWSRSRRLVCSPSRQAHQARKIKQNSATKPC